MLLSATQRQQQFSGSIKLVGSPNKTACGWGYTRTIFDLGTTYDAKKSDTSALNITRRHIAGFQELISLGGANRYYAVVNAEAYHNNSLGIRLQQDYGGGLGGLFFGDNLEFAADIRGVGQQFYKQANQRYAAAGLRENYSIGLPFLAQEATIGETFSVILPVAEERSRQFRAFAVLRIPFNPKVAFSVTAYDDYAQNARCSAQSDRSARFHDARWLSRSHQNPRPRGRKCRGGKRGLFRCRPSYRAELLYPNRPENLCGAQGCFCRGPLWLNEAESDLPEGRKCCPFARTFAKSGQEDALRSSLDNGAEPGLRLQALKKGLPGTQAECPFAKQTIDPIDLHR